MKHVWIVVWLCAAASCGDDGQAVADATITVDAAPDAPPDAGNLAADAGTDATLLSMQGVYGNFAMHALPSDAIAYSVNHELWADGATKRRWLILSPTSAPINNADQEHWIFPVGARLVKEFSRDGTLVETRIVERVADISAAPTYSLRTYVWRADGLDADLDLDGAIDVRGTAHDAPSAAQCLTCHNGELGKVLGFSAVQLPPATLTMLSASGKLSVPIGAGTTFGPTGATTTVAALGYLHANCGHCHNPSGAAGTINNMTLRLDAASKAADLEPGYLTTVNVNVTGNGLGATKRIELLNSANSAVFKRMSVRGAGQMPLIATETVDPTGVAALASFIGP